MQSEESVLWNFNFDLFFQSQGYKGQHFLGAGQWQRATALHQLVIVRVNIQSTLLVDPVARLMFSMLGALSRFLVQHISAYVSVSVVTPLQAMEDIIERLVCIPKGSTWASH